MNNVFIYFRLYENNYYLKKNSLIFYLKKTKIKKFQIIYPDIVFKYFTLFDACLKSFKT
jgi:hypothetical protein